MKKEKQCGEGRVCWGDDRSERLARLASSLLSKMESRPRDTGSNKKSKRTRESSHIRLVG